MIRRISIACRKGQSAAGRSSGISKGYVSTPFILHYPSTPPFPFQQNVSKQSFQSNILVVYAATTESFVIAILQSLEQLALAVLA